MTAPADTLALRALEAKATKGEWVVEREAIVGRVGISALLDGHKTFVTWSMDAGPDGDLIVAMRNNFLLLLDELDALRKARTVTEADVERAARAICVADGYTHPDENWREETNGEINEIWPDIELGNKPERWRLYERKARAALLARGETT